MNTARARIGNCIGISPPIKNICSRTGKQGVITCTTVQRIVSACTCQAVIADTAHKLFRIGAARDRVIPAAAINMADHGPRIDCVRIRRADDLLNAVEAVTSSIAACETARRKVQIDGGRP